jgi:hypothetical protein
MWWRKLIAKIFGYKVVWLIDFNGEYSLRLAYTTPSGKVWAYRFRTTNAIVILNPDKTVSGKIYVQSWMEV